MEVYIASPRIFYHAYDHDNPRGGQREVYAHVELLNDLGFDAFVFHEMEGFVVRWFTHSIKPIGPSGFKCLFCDKLDYVVLPEDLGWKITSYPGNKVVFNKHIYAGFAALGFDGIASQLYCRSDIKAVITVSDHNREYVRFGFPDMRVFTVDPLFNDAAFYYEPMAKKQQIIAVAAKETTALASVFHLLLSRAEQNMNGAGEFRWVVLRNLSEAETSETLRKSFIFLFLSTLEGLERLPIEAVMSGTLVLARRGTPLDSVLPQPYLFDAGDLIGFVQGIERFIQQWPDRVQFLTPLTKMALASLVNFNRSSVRKQLADTWMQIMA